MEALELRVGNLVKRRVKDESLTVDLDLLVKIQRQPFLFNPIPLTEEWLLKFGFYKDIYHKFLMDVFELGLMDDDFAENQYTLQIARGLCLKIKHVHQLQNLYFALTNQELTTE